VTGGGATITGNGTATVTVSGTAAQINAAIASITYAPLADFNTATAFNLTVVTTDGLLTDTDTVGITVNAVADIVADTVATNEDTAVVFNAITGTNGSSADNFENGGRAITSVTQGANGSVTFLANGQITYTPNTNFFGSDSFTYTVTSGGVAETATVTVNVSPVNDAPVAVDDDFVAAENDGPVVVGNAITNNDTDIDGDDLVAVMQTGVAGSAGGLFSIDEDGVVTFDANGDFEDLAFGETRETTFTYEIEDGAGGTDTATVTVTVSGANDAPVVTGLIGTQWNDDSESVSIDLSVFFSDADSSDDLIYTATGLPAGLSLDPDTGLLSGTIAPSASASGPYTVEVTVNDGNGGLITQTFTWNVFNPAPVAANDDFAAGEDDAAAVVGNVLINDGDPDNDALSAQAASGGGSNGGQFTIAANGTVTFDADGDFDDLAVGETRETTFTYTLVDADGATGTAVITVTVTGANDAPVVVAGNADRTDTDSAVISLDTSVYFDDIDGSDVLTFTATGLPDGLSIDAATGIISGTIDSSASVGGPYSIEVTAEDESGATVTHAFVWTVTNPAPIAEADEFTANEDDAAAVVGNALANDSDPDGDSYSAQIATGVSGSNGGVFSIAANGDVTFDPAGAFNSLAAGETAVTSFTYTLIDADGATTTATFTVEVTGENDAPVAVGTIATQSSNDAEVIAGLDLSGFFADPDSGDVLTYSTSGLPAGLTIDSATGVISGTIDASASVGGPYAVIVTATDENGALVTQSFSWQISNPGPLAENDDFNAGEDDAAAVVGNAILNNDSDPDGDSLSAVVQSGVAGTQGGLFSIAANGEVSFDPNGQFEDLAAGENRTTSFTYTLVDADGASDTATVTVTVTGENDAPVTVGSINTQNRVDSAVVSLDVSGYFADADTSNVASFSASGLPSGLTIDGMTGVISGTIASSASTSGPYTVDVTMSDGNGGSVTQTFTWNVSNPGPIANDDTFTALEDDGEAAVGNAITNNDTDPDSDVLTAVSQTCVAVINSKVR
jgi:VCBS repeat-containing protein